MPVMERRLNSEELWTKWGAWYAEQRRARKLTQQAVADKAGMERTHVSDLENGKSGTKRDTVMALAEAAGLDVDEALRRAGMSTPPEVDEIIRNISKTAPFPITVLHPDHAEQYRADSENPVIVEITEQMKQMQAKMDSQAEKLDMVLEALAQARQQAKE